MGFRTRWWQACKIQNLGSEIKESHCFDTHLNFRRGFAGIRMRISVRRSWLPAIISAEDKETRFISKNFGFMITTTEFGVNFFYLTGRCHSLMKIATSTLTQIPESNQIQNQRFGQYIIN